MPVWVALDDFHAAGTHGWPAARPLDLRALALLRTGIGHGELRIAGSPWRPIGEAVHVVEIREDDRLRRIDHYRPRHRHMSGKRKRHAGQDHGESTKPKDQPHDRTH